VRDEQVVNRLRRRVHRLEVVGVGRAVVDAQDAVELAEVEREDACDVVTMREPMHGGCSFRVRKGA
jgi:hypothetical protein